VSSILCETSATRSVEHRTALEKLFARIGQLSALPSVAQRVLQVAADGESSATDLLRVVEQDPTLAIRILSSVNSSYYGLRNEIADLQSAIALLGFVEVRNLALTVYVARLCEEPSQYRTFSRDGLWRHMVATAAIARLVSRSCQRADPEEAYVTGLLHDVGKLLIEQYMPYQFQAVVDRAIEGACSVLAERQALSFDHTELGAYIAEQSGLPNNVTQAIAFHHQASEAAIRNRELLDVLVLANYFAARHGVSSLGAPDEIEAPDNSVLRGLGLRHNQLAGIWAQMAPTLAAANALAAI